MVATTLPIADRPSGSGRRRAAKGIAVEGSAGVGGDGELADQRAAFRIERDDALAAGEPDLRAVEGHAVDLVDAGIGAVFAEDFRLLFFGFTLACCYS